MTKSSLQHAVKITYTSGRKKLSVYLEENRATRAFIFRCHMKLKYLKKKTYRTELIPPRTGTDQNPYLRKTLYTPRPHIRRKKPGLEEAKGQQHLGAYVPYLQSPGLMRTVLGAPLARRRWNEEVARASSPEKEPARACVREEARMETGRRRRRAPPPREALCCSPAAAAAFGPAKLAFSATLRTRLRFLLASAGVRISPLFVHTAGADCNFLRGRWDTG